MKTYSVALEVSGPLALFSRPDTGASPTSYPAPTWSAAKGILESIAYFSSGEAWFDPVRVEICRPAGTAGGTVHWQRYGWNYGGPLRKEQSIRSGAAMQVFATAIGRPCYRIHAEIRGVRGVAGRNPRHQLQELFERRLTQGRCYKTPTLGLSEFTADYWGPCRPEWVVDETLNLAIPSMLHSVWDRAQDGRREDRFVQGLRIESGMITYQHNR